MSLEIVGLQRADSQRYRDMKAVWEACLSANVEPPADVLDYLDTASRQEIGVADAIVVRDGGLTIEINLGKLPSGVHTLRITETVDGL